MEPRDLADGMSKLSTNEVEKSKRDTLLPDDDSSQVQVTSSRPDLPSMYVAAKDFESINLKPELRRAVYGMGWDRPSKIQEVSLPLILNNPPQNLIAQAQSGTGKTAAFALGMLSRVDPEQKYPQALCVCHARELARQNFDVVKALSKGSQIEPILIVPQVPLPPVITQQIVIGTPGRIFDLINRRKIDLSRAKLFVLDEADIMLDTQGLAAQTVRVKESLPNKGADSQILLFSATYTEEVIAFAKKIVHEPYVTIRLKTKEVSLDAIAQYSIDCESEENKFNVLSELYAFLTIGQSVIFLNFKEAATTLTRKLRDAGYAVSLLHGDLLPNERDDVTADFRSGKTKVLITTNVLARGIDIPAVTLVINYDLPVSKEGNADNETYIHRIGRSGRFGRPGIAINFVSDQKSFAVLDSIQKFYQREITPLAKADLPKLDARLREIA